MCQAGSVVLLLHGRDAVSCTRVKACYTLTCRKPSAERSGPPSSHQSKHLRLSCQPSVPRLPLGTRRKSRRRLRRPEAAGAAGAAWAGAAASVDCHVADKRSGLFHGHVAPTPATGKATLSPHKPLEGRAALSQLLGLLGQR